MMKKTRDRFIRISMSLIAAIAWATLSPPATGENYEDLPSLAINEFMASNSIVLADEYGEYDDWVEIYNYGSEPVNLEGMYLSDKSDNPQRWQFPEPTWLEPGRFLLVWTDGQPEQGPLHTNFRLDRDGEEIILTTQDGIILDWVVFSEQDRDVSEGRIPDGTGEFTVLMAPSPGGPNTGFWKDPPLAGFQVR